VHKGAQHVKHTTRVVAALGTAAGIVVSGAVLSPAAACSLTGDCDSTPTPQSDGRTITVSVTGTFVGGGSDGSGGSGSTSVSVPTPCWYSQGKTGKEFAEWYEDPANQQMFHGVGGVDPYPGYEKHRNDTKGHWYSSSCSSETFGDDLDAFFDYANEWFAENESVYVPDGEQPPIPPIPPEILLQAARDAMTLPEPTFDWNPKLAGGGASLVNLDTWFWVDGDHPDTGTVTASAGGNSVTVNADLDGVEFAAPTAGAVTCADGGSPWSPATPASDCTLTFTRSDAATPVTATSVWTLSWTANGVPQGQLEAMSASAQGEVPVQESQALVREVS
jgi:hypothetical protein